METRPSMNSVNKPSLPTDIAAAEPQRMWPSWLMSLLLHGLVFGGLVWGFDRHGVPEGSGAEFRDVGLFDKGDLPGDSSADSPSPDSAASRNAAESGAAGTSSAEPLLSGSVPDAGPAVSLQLPVATTIGSGVPLTTGRPNAAAGAAGQPHPGSGRGNGTVRGAPGGGSGPRFGKSDGTSFFQVSAQGEHFFYVVDCSGSMDENNAIGVARAELMASIERLDSIKRFQVLFYDSDLHPMLNGKQDVFFATDINRTFARQFINSQQPRSGTMHRPALMTALRSAPDVIFFLTDGDTPELTARDLQDLLGTNRNNSQIHVIQFGKGAKLGGTNWLEQLAKDHRGTYRYRDVAAFRDR